MDFYYHVVLLPNSKVNIELTGRAAADWEEGDEKEIRE